MAKIKTIKIKLGETIYEIVVKCNTNGKFTFEAPASLISIVVFATDYYSIFCK